MTVADDPCTRIKTSNRWETRRVTTEAMMRYRALAHVIFLSLSLSLPDKSPRSCWPEQWLGSDWAEASGGGFRYAFARAPDGTFLPLLRRRCCCRCRVARATSFLPSFPTFTFNPLLAVFFSPLRHGARKKRPREKYAKKGSLEKNIPGKKLPW